MNLNKKFAFFITLALVIKFSLFVYATIHVPQLKMEPDSADYLYQGKLLASDGVFARVKDGPGRYFYEHFRTPGYPFFLAVVHGLLKIPLDGVILIQLLLNCVTAFMVYKTAIKIDVRLGFLAAFIMLIDLGTTVYSLMIMTEALFVFLIAQFMYKFTRYIETGKRKFLIGSAIILVLATYVRPASYFLGLAVAVFILYLLIRKTPKVKFNHIILFLCLTYSLLALWHGRNYYHSQKPIFSSINSVTVDGEGMIGSFAKNTDKKSKGLPPVAYYANVAARSVLNLFTRPASLKYFGSKTLTAVGKTFSYPWIAFWFLGFLLGMAKAKNDVYLHFFMFVTLYFSIATVVGTMWGAGARFRIPMMPFVAILSSYGWLQIKLWIRRKNLK